MYCTLESTLSNEELFLEQAFPRKSIFFRGRPHICCSEKIKNKMAAEEGNWPTSLLLVPLPLSFILSIPAFTTEGSWLPDK